MWSLWVTVMLIVTKIHPYVRLCACPQDMEVIDAYFDEVKLISQHGLGQRSQTALSLIEEPQSNWQIHRRETKLSRDRVSRWVYADSSPLDRCHDSRIVRHHAGFCGELYCIIHPFSPIVDIHDHSVHHDPRHLHRRCVIKAIKNILIWIFVQYDIQRQLR
jgi:hypothetical protein